ncbi:MAG: hypothetical protein HKN23_01390, partial [Verrucomicrobiales bacterium]|nr:hypothetical protein [Verrucomicrobiales bacterium]
MEATEQDDPPEVKAKPKLLRYLIVLTVFFLLFERFVTVNGPLFFALSDKILLKAKMLERAP